MEIGNTTHRDIEWASEDMALVIHHKCRIITPRKLWSLINNELTLKYHGYRKTEESGFGVSL